ncbi:hypothetical protein FRC14_007079 [Serendipita sp. 396]|nr:hypothetical protein FRC14_007079 [Serendipita sp. 396]KAG8778782.1 hypothetical protein FRC15_010553 [Serendipita sp. 397]KAG8857690.1 hypothetical protein FRB91_011107 [Serendipita sp. 411]KAG8863615.1 hypothetical protein FRC20_010689 [Serendipita sp. 405]
MVWFPKCNTKRRSRRMSNFPQGLPDEANDQVDDQVDDQARRNFQNSQTGFIDHPYYPGANAEQLQWHSGFPVLTTPRNMIPVEQLQHWPSSYDTATPFPGTSVVPSGSMPQAHPMIGPSYQLPPPHVPTQPMARPITLPEILGKLIDYFSQAEWVQKHEKEPPLLDNDPLIRLRLVQPGGSRFDALLFWDGEKDHCQVPGCQGSRDRTQHYTTERRPRALVHVYGHFGYKPIPCEGECGRVSCEMRFPDKPSKTEHVRTYTTPRATCAVCRSTIARKNYKRHLRDVDRLREDQIAALLGSDEEAAGMSA